MSYDNVIIFGAGASRSANIPLLSNFVDTMWEYAVRGRSPGGFLSSDDKKLLTEANRIRYALERYNSRANFDLRNLEDVLSLLSFESLAGGNAFKKYNIWKRAITRTVELSTNQPCNNKAWETPEYRITPYHQLWNTLLGTKAKGMPPALITFNYDLVLERTLWDFFHFYQQNPAFKPAKGSCKVNYFFPPNDFTIEAVIADYKQDMGGGTPTWVQRNGLTAYINNAITADTEIAYLKLHGSLNWPNKFLSKTGSKTDKVPERLPIEAVETPLILPPVFNKMNSGKVDPVWRKALEILRQAKHIIFVGYSLPRTDIYMQYFMKSAVGPNSNLQKIIVFDPLLFGESEARTEMKKRYQECFSPQFQAQINFKPFVPDTYRREDLYGTFEHFVYLLNYKPENLLFYS